MALWKNDEELFELVRDKLTTGLVADAMCQLGVAHPMLPSGIRAIERDMVMIGYAMPVLEGEPFESTASPSKPFGLFFESLDDLKPSEVYVISGGPQRYPRLGDLTLTRAIKLGAAGAVIDGFVRDTKRVAELGIPTFALGSYAHALGPLRNIVDFRCALQIDNVSITPGDIVYGDADGVCVIPKDAKQDVFAQALEKWRLEEAVQEGVENGMSVTEAFQKYGVI